MEVDLGRKVKDKVTGFKGVAVARCVYLNGCVQFEIEPLQLLDGVPQKSYWLDEQRVVPIEEKSKVTNVQQFNTTIVRDRVGGNQNHPTGNNPPSLAGYEP